MSSSESDKSGDENEASKVETQVTVTWLKTVTETAAIAGGFLTDGFC